MYMCSAGFAPSTCSATAQTIVRGTIVPPSSGSVSMRHHSAPCSACQDFLNDSGSVTECVAGSNTGGLRSASANDAASGPSASFAAS